MKRWNGETVERPNGGTTKRWNDKTMERQNGGKKMMESVNDRHDNMRASWCEILGRKERLNDFIYGKENFLFWGKVELLLPTCQGILVIRWEKSSCFSFALRAHSGFVDFAFRTRTGAATTTRALRALGCNSSPSVYSGASRPRFAIIILSSFPVTMYVASAIRGRRRRRSLKSMSIF